MSRPSGRFKIRGLHREVLVEVVLGQDYVRITEHEFYPTLWDVVTPRTFPPIPVLVYFWGRHLTPPITPIVIHQINLETEQLSISPTMLLRLQSHLFFHFANTQFFITKIQLFCLPLRGSSIHQALTSMNEFRVLMWFVLGRHNLPPTRRRPSGGTAGGSSTRLLPSRSWPCGTTSTGGVGSPRVVRRTGCL